MPASKLSNEYVCATGLRAHFQTPRNTGINSIDSSPLERRSEAYLYRITVFRSTACVCRLDMTLPCDNGTWSISIKDAGLPSSGQATFAWAIGSVRSLWHVRVPMSLLLIPVPVLVLVLDTRIKTATSTTSTELLYSISSSDTPSSGATMQCTEGAI